MMNQEADNVKVALESMANISEAMTLFQNLELAREERRECNKLIVACLQNFKMEQLFWQWSKFQIVCIPFFKIGANMSA